MTAKLEIHLLGHLRALVDGAPLPLKFPPRTGPLWAYLLLHRGSRLQRNALAYILWPDESEVDARTNLRRHLHQLSRALRRAAAQEPCLLVDRASVTWNLEADFWLDVDEFERLSAAPETLAEAVNLYAGDLLEGWYDDWILYERERLQTIYRSNLAQLILQRRSEHAYQAAIAYAMQLLAYDPLHEDAIRQLMSLRYEIGDRAGALQAYEQYRQRLRDELSVEVMPETLALQEAILRNAPLPEFAARLDESIQTHVPGPTNLVLPFVGREAEMQQLLSLWKAAAAGHGNLILVSGEAGIGKTRLMTEFAFIAESRGARVLHGGTGFMEPVPYQALAIALRSALPMLVAVEIDPLWLAIVASLLPELRTRRTDLPVMVPALDPEHDRLRLYEALARCLEALARPRPLVVILSDLHWASSATIAVVEFIARGLQRLPVLMLATYRPENTPRTHPLRELRRRLQSEGLLAHLSLDRLTISAVQDLVGQVSGLAPASTDLAQHLFSASDGNPLFLLELIQDLIERGQIAIEGGRWRVTSIEREAIPQHMRATVISRVERLSPPARFLLEIAAAIGSAFNIELVCEVCGWSENQALDRLDELLDRQLIREAAGAGHFEYTFTHQAIQAVVYDELSSDERRRQHRRIARVMEGLNPNRLDELAGELALHFDRGGDTGRAANYYRRAAQRAQAVYADEEAIAALSRALELTSDRRARFDTLALREVSYGRRGLRTEQAADLIELDQIARALDVVDLICSVLSRRIHLEHVLGNRPIEHELIVEFAARAEDSGNPIWQAEAQRAEADYRVSQGEYDAARPRLAQALAVYRSLNHAAGQVACLCLLADIAVQRADFDEVQTLLQQASRLAEAEANQALLVQTLRAASASAFVKQQFDTARALGEQMLELCRAIGDRVGETDAHTRLATIAARVFQIERARQHYTRASTLAEAMHDRTRQAAIALNSAILTVHLGRYDDGLALFRQAEAIFATLNDRRGQTLCALNIAYAASRQGDFHTAKQSAVRSLELARSVNLPLLEAMALGNLGLAERELGELDEAVAHTQAGLELHRQFGQQSEVGLDLADLAVTYLRAGQRDRARQLVAEIMALHDAAPDQMVQPQYLLWAAAQAYQASGDLSHAAELLQRAYTSLQQRAAAIPDAESQTTFLVLSFNRQLLDAHDHDLWPEYCR